MKLTGCTYACNSLTDFEYEELVITGIGNNVNQLKIHESTSNEPNFRRVLAIWNHCALPAAFAAALFL